jgi:hypothetical protein
MIPIFRYPIDQLMTKAAKSISIHSYIVADGRQAVSSKNSMLKKRRVNIFLQIVTLAVTDLNDDRGHDRGDRGHDHRRQWNRSLSA